MPSHLWCHTCAQHVGDEDDLYFFIRDVGNTCRSIRQSLFFPLLPDVQVEQVKPTEEDFHVLFAVLLVGLPWGFFPRHSFNQLEEVGAPSFKHRRFDFQKTFQSVRELHRRHGLLGLSYGDITIASNTAKLIACWLRVNNDLIIDTDDFYNTVHDLVYSRLPDVYYTYTNRQKQQETSRQGIISVDGDLIFKRPTNFTNHGSLINVVGKVENFRVDKFKNTNVSMHSFSHFHKGGSDCSYHTGSIAKNVFGEDLELTGDTVINEGQIVVRKKLSFDLTGDLINSALSWTNGNKIITLQPLENYLNQSVIFRKIGPSWHTVTALPSCISALPENRIILGTQRGRPLLDGPALEYALALANQSGLTATEALFKWQSNAIDTLKKAQAARLLLEDRPENSTTALIIPERFERELIDNVTDNQLFWRTETRDGELVEVPYLVTVDKNPYKSGLILAGETITTKAHNVINYGGAIVAKEGIDMDVNSFTNESLLSFRRRKEVRNGKEFDIEEIVLDSRASVATLGELNIRATESVLIIGADNISTGTTIECNHYENRPAIERSVATHREKTGSFLTPKVKIETHVTERVIPGREIVLDPAAISSEIRDQIEY